MKIQVKKELFQSLSKAVKTLPEEILVCKKTPWVLTGNSAGFVFFSRFLAGNYQQIQIQKMGIDSLSEKEESYSKNFKVAENQSPMVVGSIRWNNAFESLLEEFPILVEKMEEQKITVLN